MIKIVTDSTCDLPAELVTRYGISVVPLYINFGSEGFLDGVDITRQEFYTRLVDTPEPPTTSVPSPDKFSQIYNQLAREGATEILSIHVSNSLSAVVDMARLAASQMNGELVTVYDSGQLSLGTGFMVMAAAQLSAAGRGISDIIDHMREMTNRTHVFAALETMEYLRRSGRVNGLLAGIGSLLDIKPMLKMHQGVATSERVRTNSRAIKRLISLVEGLGPLESLALVHSNAPEKAQALLEASRHLIPGDSETLSVDVTPVIGTHIGPGAVGFACVAAA